MFDDSWALAAMIALKSDNDDKSAARNESEDYLLKREREIKAVLQSWPEGSVSW